jgi:hypothetical protein
MNQRHEQMVQVALVALGRSNGADREWIGTCTYCRDAAFSDDAATTGAGEVLPRRCTGLWSKT